MPNTLLEIQPMAPIFFTAPVNSWALQPTVDSYAYIPPSVNAASYGVSTVPPTPASSPHPSRIAHIVHSLLPTVYPQSSAVETSTAVDVLLILAIAFAVFGTSAVVWLCYRERRRRRTQPPRTVQTQQAWDSGSPFAAKSLLMPRPDLIMHIGATESKTNNALLQEVPNVWRILGRPNVATEDDYGDAIPDYHKKPHNS